MKIKKCDLYAVLIILFPICNLIGGSFGYYDEILGICGFCYLWTKFISNQLHPKLRGIAILLSMVSLIGVISNITSGICKNIFAIAVDALWLWKTFACFILASQIFKNNKISDSIIRVLYRPAKWMIYILAGLSIVGQVVNIGVTSQSAILGLKSFRFFWNSSVQTGWLIICCIIIIALSDVSEKKFKKYLIVAGIPLLLTMSSMIYCWIAVAIMLFIILRDESKFKIIYIVPIVLAILLFTWGDLQTYFIDETSSVRITLIRKGIEVANRFFPLGAGFATYGSEMASRYYSKLYVEFGWANSWAFRANSGLLNDAFFASIVGQFGWIGFGLYLVALYQLFKMINSSFVSKRVRVCSIAAFLAICAAMIGSATVKSMMGVCLFFVLGLVNGRVLGGSDKDN
ncbi:hypothetical protein [Coprococcus comes]|uniref:hypothetical protein n=1 Tax=Coprococcus comes TaxID=410072 RepID=UPI00189B886D|nr:hypothetical protein [Coprococcus comes]